MDYTGDQIVVIDGMYSEQRQRWRAGVIFFVFIVLDVLFLYLSVLMCILVCLLFFRSRKTPPHIRHHMSLAHKLTQERLDTLHFCMGSQDRYLIADTLLQKCTGWFRALGTRLHLRCIQLKIPRGLDDVRNRWRCNEIRFFDHWNT